MPELHIILDGSGQIPQLADGRPVIKVDDFTIAALPHGMSTGRPSVAVVIDLPDGAHVFAQTSLRLLLSAADAFKARYGDPRQDDPAGPGLIFMGNPPADKLPKDGVARNLEEHATLTVANTKVEGKGPDTIVHAPCPFCAAPDFLVYRLLDVQSAVSEDTTCASCARSMRGIFTEDGKGGTQVELVQTGGPDIPAWFTPIRRVDR
jgi:hypothetical protein